MMPPVGATTPPIARYRHKPSPASSRLNPPHSYPWERSSNRSWRLVAETPFVDGVLFRTHPAPQSLHRFVAFVCALVTHGAGQTSDPPASHGARVYIRPLLRQRTG